MFVCLYDKSLALDFWEMVKKCLYIKSFPKNVGISNATTLVTKWLVREKENNMAMGHTIKLRNKRPKCDIISPWERVWPFIWTNLNPFYPMMLCAKFGGNLSHVYEDYSCRCISTILLSSAFGKRYVPSVNKLDISLTNDA